MPSLCACKRLSAFWGFPREQHRVDRRDVESGDALRYVKDQTEAICIEAVKQNGDALCYVDAQMFGE